MLSLLVSQGAWTADIEYISPDEQSRLEQTFKSADFSRRTDESRLRRKWICDLYGVRTHLQVQRGLALYQWGQANWSNHGAHLVTDYAIEPHALVGHSPRFEDQVRLTSDGQIIAQLSQTSPDHHVLAYALCR